VNPKTYLLEATHAALLNAGTALLPHALSAGRVEKGGTILAMSFTVLATAPLAFR
jgi:dTDP-4-amino-4,6-dideoxygalactose transaminase